MSAEIRGMFINTFHCFIVMHTRKFATERAGAGRYLSSGLRPPWGSAPAAPSPSPATALGAHSVRGLINCIPYIQVNVFRRLVTLFLLFF